MKAIAESPTKTIITGEHFVVHGAWALAAAVDRKVRVEVEPARGLEVSSDRFPDGAAELAPVEKVVKGMAAARGFSPDLRVSVTSKVPDGAGLGSSAATMVAVAAAVAKLNSHRLSTSELVGFAMLGEQEVHGRPSGVDVNICAYGGVILYRMGSAPKRVSLRGERRLLLVYSGKKRSTMELITRVSSMKKRYPALFQGLASGASEVSLLAADLLAEGDMAGLGRLMTFNHGVLSAVGASNGTLDELVDLLLSSGCTGAKLTGAGGGGSVIATAAEGRQKSIVNRLEARGLDAFQVKIPVGGVESWLRP